MNTVIVVGNMKPQSRTFQAARLAAKELTGTEPSATIDVVDLGEGLLGWGDPAVAQAIETVTSADVVVFASPTYKATYSGLLKLFLDQFPMESLRGIVAIPMMVGASPAHALAPELTLKPVLVELGAVCPTRALYLQERDHDSLAALSPWLEPARAQVAASLRAEVGA